MSVPLRVGIIGARRVHQGLGPFVARDLARAGAQVTAVLGTSPATAAMAAGAVESATGRAAFPAARASEFFAQRLDAVCVLSPAGTHLAHVAAALEHGCHVLCEKPLAWSPEADWARTIEDLENRFAARGLLLGVNAQWPHVLPAFEEVTGHATAGAQSLAMGLAPASIGRQMLGDALPHPLSVAQALCPSLAGARQVAIEPTSERSMTVRAELFGPDRSIDLTVHLDGDAREQPRSAWLAIDGRRADRCVRTADYALFLRSGARLVDLPDPLTARVAAFVDGAEQRRSAPAGAVTPSRTHSRRAAMLAAVVAAYDASPR